MHRAIPLALALAACGDPSADPAETSDSDPPDTTDAPTDPPVGPPCSIDGTFIQVSAGDGRVCARDIDQELRCWDANGLAMAGVPAGAWTDVSTGGPHTCAVAEADESIACWGARDQGQTVPPLGLWADVDVAGASSCAVDRAGRLACWGEGAEAAPAAELDRIAVGSGFACGRDEEDGSLLCWGRDDHGLTTTPPDPVLDLALGQDHGCAIRANERVACWGSDDQGQLAAPEGKFGAVAAGARHSCALALDGHVTCWGDPTDGVLDVPDGTYGAIDAGGALTCGLRPDGSITCWGRCEGPE